MNLITGATGLVGAHVALQLLQQGKSVVAIKRNGSDITKTKKLFSYYTSDSENLFNKIKADVAVTKPVLTPQNNLPADSNSESNKSSVRAEVEKDGDSHALEESKHTYARLDMPSHSLLNKISVRLYSSPVQLSSSLSAEMGLEKNPEIQYSHRAAVNDFPGDKKDATRYLMFKDSEGRFIKISKKLTNLFCCVSGEEQDDNCNDQLKKWREKIARSSFIPSPDNFMDILDLVSSLQDSRN